MEETKSTVSIPSLLLLLSFGVMKVDQQKSVCKMRSEREREERGEGGERERERERERGNERDGRRG